MRKTVCVIVAGLCLLISACDKPQETAQIARPVKTIRLAGADTGNTAIMTGQLAAHTYANVSFRLAGKIAKRFVSTGSAVTKDQTLVQLDDSIAKDNLTAATAEHTAALAVLTQAELIEKRASLLIKSSAISKNDYDDAQRQLKTAQAQVSATEAKAQMAKEQLDYTILRAEQDGLIVEKLSEEGEVVAAGQPVLRVAYGNQRDAVFDVPEEMMRAGLTTEQKVRVCLDSDRALCAEGTIYEIAPESDAQTRTYQVKALLTEPPEKMLLGATVTGRFAQNDEKGGLSVPAASLSSLNGKPALWVVDPQTHTVSARVVEVSKYTSDTVLIAAGVKQGDEIVTAGVQALHEGQQVKPAEASDDRR